MVAFFNNQKCSKLVRNKKGISKPIVDYFGISKPAQDFERLTSRDRMIAKHFQSTPESIQQANLRNKFESGAELSITWHQHRAILLFGLRAHAPADFGGGRRKLQRPRH